jgi:hypothetical protein
MNLTTKLTLALSLALTLLGIAYAQVAKPPQAATPSSANGRYQIVMSTLSGKNTFMVDTQTGRVWQLTQFTDIEDEPTVWLNQTRLDGELDIQRYLLSHRKKQP